MKVLINPDYFFVRDIFYPSVNGLIYVKSIFDNLFQGNKDVELKYLISERIYYQIDSEFLKTLDYVVIFDSDVRNALEEPFVSHREVVSRFYSGDFTDKQFVNMINLYKEKIGDFIPEVIFSFEFCDKILEKVYPNALQLSFQGGCFKRGFGPASYVLDPCGAIKFSALNAYKKEISDLGLTEEDNIILENFKQDLRTLFLENNTNKKYFNELRKKFDYLILLPMQFNGHYSTDTENDFSTQYDIVNYVMENIPPNVGVVVTEHDHNRFLEGGVIEQGGFLKWFENKYSNFIFMKDSSGKPLAAPSLFLLPFMDAIVNVSSTTVWSALFFDLKIISIGKHNNDFCKDSQGLDNLLETLKTPKKDKNSLIYWMLTNYFIFDFKYYEKDYFYNFLLRKRQKFLRDGINFTFFEKNAELEQVCNHIIECINLSKIQQSKIKYFGYTNTKNFLFLLSRIRNFIVHALKLIMIKISR